MNLFARSLGGAVGDALGSRLGLYGRTLGLFTVLLCSGVALMVFSQAHDLLAALIVLIVFSLFLQAAEGATFAVVPFLKPGAVGMVSGIVGAGGNVGAILAGLLFRGGIAWSTAWLVLGGVVSLVSFLVLVVRFSEEEERQAVRAMAPVSKPTQLARVAGCVTSVS